MESWVFAVLAALIGGGLAGGIYTHWISTRDAKEQSRRREDNGLASLRDELAYVKQLCRHNARANGEGSQPFLRFPTNVALNAAFQQRHLFPRLVQLQANLASHTLALIHLNQMIDFHEQMFSGSTLQSNNNIGQQVDNIAQNIRALCDGKMKLVGLGIEVDSDLPSITNELVERIVKLTASMRGESRFSDRTLFQRFKSIGR